MGAANKTQFVVEVPSCLSVNCWAISDWVSSFRFRFGLTLLEYFKRGPIQISDRPSIRSTIKLNCLRFILADMSLHSSRAPGIVTCLTEERRWGVNSETTETTSIHNTIGRAFSVCAPTRAPTIPLNVSMTSPKAYFWCHYTQTTFPSVSSIELHTHTYAFVGIPYMLVKSKRSS